MGRTPKSLRLRSRYPVFHPGTLILLWFLSEAPAPPAFSALIPLENPSFEMDENADGIPDGWHRIGGTSSAGIWIDSATRARTGRKYVLQTEYCYAQTVREIRPGFRYLVRGYTNRGDDGTADVNSRMEIWFPATDGSSLTARESYYFAKDGWIPIGVLGTAPTHTQGTARIQLAVAPGHWAGFEDVSLCDQILADASVPCPTRTEWIPLGNTHIAEEAGPEPNWALAMEEGGGWHQEIAALRDFRATLAFRARSTWGTATLEIEIGYGDRRGLIFATEVRTYPVHETWSDFAHPFGIGKDTGLLRITVRNPNPNAVLLVDDFDLVYLRIPFSPLTPDGDGLRDEIPFEMALNTESFVRAEILDATGTSLITLFEENRAEGLHSFSWKGESREGGVPDGTYTVSVSLYRGEGVVSVTDTVRVDRSRPIPEMEVPDLARSFFPRGFFLSPPPNPGSPSELVELYRSFFQEIHAISGNCVEFHGDHPTDPELVRLAHEAGLSSIVSGGWSTFAREIRNNPRPLYADQATLETLVTSFISAYAAVPGVVGYLPHDEPPSAQMEDTGMVMRLFQATDPERPALVAHDTTNVLRFVDRVEPPVFLWYRYPLRQNSEPGDLAAFITEAEFFGIAARERGLPQWFVFQGFNSGWQRLPTPSELRIMLYAALANGCTGLLGWIYEDSDRSLWNAVRFTTVDGEPLREAIGEVFRRIEENETLFLNLVIHEDFTREEGTVYARTLRDSRNGEVYIMALNKDPIRPVRFFLEMDLSSLNGSLSGMVDRFTGESLHLQAGSHGTFHVAGRLGAGDAALIHLMGMTAPEPRLPNSPQHVFIEENVPPGLWQGFLEAEDAP